MVAFENGKIGQSVIRSSQSEMTIHFQSDDIGTRKGFKIKVHFVLSGKLKFNNMPGKNSTFGANMKTSMIDCINISYTF